MKSFFSTIMFAVLFSTSLHTHAMDTSQSNEKVMMHFRLFSLLVHEDYELSGLFNDLEIKPDNGTRTHVSSSTSLQDKLSLSFLEKHNLNLMNSIPLMTTVGHSVPIELMNETSYIPEVTITKKAIYDEHGEVEDYQVTEHYLVDTLKNGLKGEFNLEKDQDIYSLNYSLLIGYLNLKNKQELASVEAKKLSVEPKRFESIFGSSKLKEGQSLVIFPFDYPLSTYEPSWYEDILVSLGLMNQRKEIAFAVITPKSLEQVSLLGN